MVVTEQVKSAFVEVEDEEYAVPLTSLCVEATSFSHAKPLLIRRLVKSFGDAHPLRRRRHGHHQSSNSAGKHTTLVAQWRSRDPGQERGQMYLQQVGRHHTSMAIKESIKVLFGSKQTMTYRTYAFAVGMRAASTTNAPLELIPLASGLVVQLFVGPVPAGLHAISARLYAEY